MTTNEKSIKLIRSMAIGPTSTAPASALWHLKLVYEFWGFCVNGGSNLRNPGGFANNGISMPVGFSSGTLVLLASGSDGSTLNSDNVFSAPSVNWTSGTLSNSWLVTWSSGSSSTDDSIYKIRSVVNSSSILIDTVTGGTPASGSAKPFFTARSGINFRVIDFVAASNLAGFVDNQYMVMQLNGNAINLGQANSQAKLRVQSSAQSIAITLSPSGSWNGSAFTDSTWELVPDAFNADDQGSNSGPWITAGNTGLVSMFADQGSLQTVISGDWKFGISSYFHIEIPIRLYPQQIDPNPICASMVASQGIASSMVNNVSNFNGFLLANPLSLSTSERAVTLARTLVGHSFDSNYHSNSKAYNPISARFVQSTYNAKLNNVILSEVVLMNRSSSTRYNLSRNQLRRALFLPLGASYPNFSKFGVNGEWVHMGYGILWPWDNAVINRGLFV